MTGSTLLGLPFAAALSTRMAPPPTYDPHLFTGVHIQVVGAAIHDPHTVIKIIEAVLTIETFDHSLLCLHCPGGTHRSVVVANLLMQLVYHKAVARPYSNRVLAEAQRFWVTVDADAYMDAEADEKHLRI